MGPKTAHVLRVKSNLHAFKSNISRNKLYANFVKSGTLQGGKYSAEEEKDVTFTVIFISYFPVFVLALESVLRAGDLISGVYISVIQNKIVAQNTLSAGSTNMMLVSFV